ncbi:kinesin-like protein KIF26A [Antennarius striatus]|uniref:kinesin-like protein KIF26A n=1 Tax=Antennarius striatus TaxID=241820 RepID=UPI0035AF0538
MYSQYWNAARGHRPDYRRYTVVEGATPLPLGSTAGRKRLRSAGEDGEEGRSCASRPNPEGSLSANELSRYGEPEEEEEELKMCHRCHAMTSHLERQAAALADSSAEKDPAYTCFLFDKLQRPQWPRRGRHAPIDVRCDVCGVSSHQLRRLALCRALCINREMTPRPSNAAAAATASASSCQASGCILGGDKLPVKQQRWSYEEQMGAGALWGWGGVQSTYLGAGGAKGLATVTPLPLDARHHLEGVWRVSCPRPEDQQHATASRSDGIYVTMRSLAPDARPAAHSIATQTSRPPSAAASFFIRAAQKLSLSRRRRSQPGPASPPGEALGPLLYTGGFSGALQLSPPAIPPCLLRAGSKVKDKPGMGKVRVMVRICSKSSDSASSLRVDGRKKQLTLCEPSAAGGLPGPAHRRSASTPKTFAFNAVFSHDATQAEVCSGTVAEVIQSVVNGADGCIFCFGHANLGKTYTMIGRDCSTQSLGVAPTAISWLFKVIEERREKLGGRFSLGVSAVEISGREETLTDLLAGLSPPPAGGPQEAPGPAVALREDPLCGSQLQNQTELQATNAKQAAFFLDAALAARSNQEPGNQEMRRNSHFLFTLHLYQERLDKTHKATMSGRSRLHLLDLGSCESDISRTREGGGGQCLSLSALGNVILALANGAKHVPYRDSKLTMLLSESLGNINCQTTMIAHVSDAPANYMETLTTVQLASRIHRMRKKKSKYASSSSGGESSCDEGPSHRPPHMQPFHPRIVALDPDTPLLPSSDPDYSSSSEHSCDTVIYVGPGGTAISDRELSDNEGPPAFVPIIPSLNRKRVKDSPRTDGDHFKCNTFAELQERLDFIDGSESPAVFGTEGKAAQTAALSNQTGVKAMEAAAPPTSGKNSLDTDTKNPGQKQTPSANNLMDTSKRTSADGEKLSATPIQPCSEEAFGDFSKESGPVVREKVYLKGGAASQPGEGVGRTPPVGMCQPAGSQRVLDTGGYPLEVDSLRAALFGRYFERDFLRTTITLQQPVELNSEDELVFTVVEEFPHGLVPDNGRPSNLLSFNNERSWQASATESRPVSIISSINDEYDAYTSQLGAVGSGADVGGESREIPFPKHGKEESSVGSWPGEVSADSAKSESSHSMSSLYMRDTNVAKENASTPTSPSVFLKQPFLQGIKSLLNDSGCFPDLDSNQATPSKPSFTKCSPSPESAKASPKASLKGRASTLNASVSAQVPHHASHSNLSRKTKPTSSATGGCSRQEGRNDDILLQGSSGRNSNSVPRPPKVQVSSSSDRVVDGCEKSSNRRGDTLIKLPRLTRGATTLGTVSTPQSSESKWGHEASLVTGTLRFSSLGKRSNEQKGLVMSKFGNISPPVPPVRQSNQDQKTRTVSSSALKTTSDEEVSTRHRADSFSCRTSSLKIEHSKTSSLKTRGARVESFRHYESLMSLERCDSPTLTGSKPELFRENIRATLGGTNRSNRSVPRLGVPASPSTSASSCQDSPCVFATTMKALGQVKGNSSSRASVSGGYKVRSMSTGGTKSPSLSPKPLDNVAGRHSSLFPTIKSPARSSTGAKMGRGTIMGTRQAISRAANSRVSELATGGQGKQLSRDPVAARNDGIDGGNSAISGSPINQPIPSPYSKITAPRRPQRYSSGHGSDNSSILSGELPPAMGRTALFYHSGGSSGYESMIRDSETTGSTSSAHDSMSESGPSLSNRGRVSKSPKKRGNGFQRRRLIPAPLPDASSLGRKAGGQWAERPALSGALKEPFEIKVYEIDDMDHLQRRREAAMATEQPFHDVEKGLLYFNARLRMLEKRQQRIGELRRKHQELKAELNEAKTRLMLDPSKWAGEFDVDPDLDPESQDHLEALVQVTAELQDVVTVCKARLMMETCFDIAVTTAGAGAALEGQQEVEV